MAGRESAEAGEAEPLPKKRRLGLAEQVFIGLGLGIAVGAFFGEEAAFLKIAGDGFIALLQITVIPYVIVALITSIGRLTLDDVKLLGVRAGSILLVLWAAGLIVVLLTPLAFPDWPSASFFSTSQVEEAEPIDFLQLYIPSNFFSSLSNAIVPAIVVFSILFGLGLINATKKETVLDLLSTVAEALMGITGIIAKLAPYGVFAITASAAGTLDVADLGRLQVYIVVYVVMALILSLWLIPGLITALTPLRYGDVLRTFRGPLITAFATGNLLIVLPILAADSKELIGRTTGASSQPTERKESSVDILIPAAFPFPNLGVVLALMFVPFGGWYVGSAVSIGDYPTLVFAGLASLFGGPVLALPFLFDLLRLPADLFQVFVTVDVIGSRFGTLLAAMHLIAIALIGTFAMDGAITLSAVRLIRFAVVSLALMAAALIGIRAFYTYVYVEPYTKDKLLSALHLIDDPQPHKVYREPPKERLEEAGDVASFKRLRDDGVLRACYEPGDYPSSFFNDEGELVGFDIEMAHRFARSIDAEIEFLPARTGKEAWERVNSGYCDAVMAMQPITPRRTEEVALTSPVLNLPAGLIVSDHRRDEFQDWSRIREIEGLRVAVLDNNTARNYLARLVPDATPVLFRDKGELDAILAAGAMEVDAVLMVAEEGAAWTVRYPAFSLVIPAPTLFVPFGYSVGRDDEELRRYLDAWLLNARSDGTIGKLYSYWMLGQVEETQPPRWSVIRDVLHWID